MENKNNLLKNVNKHYFAMLEAALYLDMYPDNADALKYFNEQRAEYNSAAEQYESKFGPITQNSDANSNSWQWTQTPWPWEREAN